MKALLAFVLLLVSGWVGEAQALAESATEPSTQPAFPKPADLIKKLKDLQAKHAAMPKVAYFDLSKPVAEKPPEFSLFGDGNEITLHTLLQRLHQARDDQNIKAVLLTLGDGGMNFSQAQEVRDALADLTKARKPVYVYADGYDTVSYTVATGASHICLLEGGEIMIPGVGLEATFAKGLLDKVGVVADYVQIGKYKGADEEYTRTGASAELKGELTKLTDSLYEQIVGGISSHRSLPKETVSKMIDDTILTAQGGKDRGFIDDLVDEDGLRPLLAKELGHEVELVPDYGAAPRDAVDFSNPFSLLSLLSKRTPPPEQPSVAIIYAEGVITDGDGDGGLFSDSGVGGGAMRRAFRAAARDENVKGVVLRIDSPGGSALASEVMWQAARHLAEKKPLIVSVGGMAASGGYYLASASDKIFADPSAIVGSIGVVGGKFVTKDLYEKLGLSTEAFQRGSNAGLFSSNRRFTDAQKAMVTQWMQATYEQFKDRVMKTRGDKIKDIDAVAQGRVFLAQQAKDLGMVDEIGGLENAISSAATAAGLEEGKYEVRVLPGPKTLGDILAGGAGGPDAAFPFKPTLQLNTDSVLRAVSPATRQVLSRQLQMLQLLQARPVVLVSPYVVTWSR